MAGILYVVATPIGNLEDVTLRALRILREASVIAAEDTRRTAKLLQHYSISTRTTSLHEHNEREKTPRLIARLRDGESVALVSDAGTPAISDPGQHLVAAVRAAGIRVEVVPGPSSVMAAVSASGLPASEFTFLGFPPNRSNDRRIWFQRLALEARLVVFFEAPHRISRTLDDLAAAVGESRVVGIGRELTKTHEELVIKPIYAWLRESPRAQGEFTVLVTPALDVGTTSAGAPELPVLVQELGELTNKEGLGRREALKRLSEKYGVPVNALYRLLSINR